MNVCVAIDLKGSLLLYFIFYFDRNIWFHCNLKLRYLRSFVFISIFLSSCFTVSYEFNILVRSREVKFVSVFLLNLDKAVSL